MMRFRVWAYLVAAVTLSLTLLIAPVRGQGKPDAAPPTPNGVKVKIDKVDGTNTDAVVTPRSSRLSNSSINII
jgi:hypothetical protein